MRASRYPILLAPCVGSSLLLGFLSFSGLNWQRTLWTSPLTYLLIGIISTLVAVGGWFWKRDLRVALALLVATAVPTYLLSDAFLLMTSYRPNAVDSVLTEVRDAGLSRTCSWSVEVRYLDRPRVLCAATWGSRPLVSEHLAVPTRVTLVTRSGPFGVVLDAVSLQ